MPFQGYSNESGFTPIEVQAIRDKESPALAELNKPETTSNIVFAIEKARDGAGNETCDSTYIIMMSNLARMQMADNENTGGFSPAHFKDSKLTVAEGLLVVANSEKLSSVPHPAPHETSQLYINGALLEFSLSNTVEDSNHKSYMAPGEGVMVIRGNFEGVDMAELQGFFEIFTEGVDFPVVVQDIGAEDKRRDVVYETKSAQDLREHLDNNSGYLHQYSGLGGGGGYTVSDSPRTPF